MGVEARRGGDDLDADSVALHRVHDRPRRALPERRASHQRRQFASQVHPLLDQHRRSVGQVTLGDGSGLGQIAGQGDPAAVVAPACGLDDDRPADPFRECIDVGRHRHLGEHRDRRAERLQRAAHHQLVLGVYEGVRRRRHVHAIGHQRIEQGAGNVLVVERHHGRARRDPPQRVQVGMRAQDDVGRDLSGRFVGSSRQHPQRLSECDRGLMRHPGQLPAADHRHDWGCAHAAMVSRAFVAPTCTGTRRMP